MNVQVVYCNHITTPLAVRERLAFASADDLNRAYRYLRTIFPQSEHVVLSTCNRVEIYTAQDETASDPGRNRAATPTQEQVAEFLSEFHRIPRDEFYGMLLAEKGPEAVRHLFEVSSSLDSMVLGEPQIVNQVKEAYRVAQENNACGQLTHKLFQGAIHVSARVRSETVLAEGRVSIASVAVGDFGKSIFDRFSDKTVVVIGAGEMAEETLRYLKEEGVREIVVVNRSLERAERLAADWGGTPRPFDELDAWMAKADVIVSTTGAARPIVDRARFAAVRRAAAKSRFSSSTWPRRAISIRPSATSTRTCSSTTSRRSRPRAKRTAACGPRRSNGRGGSSRRRRAASFKTSITRRRVRSFRSSAKSHDKFAKRKSASSSRSLPTSSPRTSRPSSGRSSASSTSFCTRRWRPCATKPATARPTASWRR